MNGGLLQYLDALIVFAGLVAGFVTLKAKSKELEKRLDELHKDINGMGGKLNKQGERIARLEGKDNADG
jgi:hypothetical protein